MELREYQIEMRYTTALGLFNRIRTLKGQDLMLLTLMELLLNVRNEGGRIKSILVIDRVESINPIDQEEINEEENCQIEEVLV